MGERHFASNSVGHVPGRQPGFFQPGAPSLGTGFGGGDILLRHARGCPRGVHALFKLGHETPRSSVPEAPRWTRGPRVAPRQRDALLLAMVVRTRPHRIRGIMHIRAGHHAHKGIMHTRAGHHAYKRPTVTTHHDQPNDSQTQHKRCRLLRTQKLQMISLKIPVPHLDLHLQAMNSILHSGTLGHQLLLNFKHSGCRHCAAE